MHDKLEELIQLNERRSRLYRRLLYTLIIINVACSLAVVALFMVRQ